MTKIEYKSYVTRCALFGDYVVEICTCFEDILYDEIWFYNKNYGIKEMIVGVKDFSTEEMNEYILDNLETWIDLYKERYED